MTDLTAPIPRDAQKCAQTKYCHEHPDGSLTLTVGLASQLLEPRELAPGASFAVTVQRLADKRWFTLDVYSDLTNVVFSGWIAKANGWR